jgi:hypothetical protein
MKKNLLVIGLALLTSITIYAQTNVIGFSDSSLGQNAYTFGTTNLLATPSYGTPVQQYGKPPSPSWNGNVPVYRFLSVTSDLSSSVLTIYYANYSTPILNTNLGTNIFVGTTNGLTLGSPIVIQHQGGATAEPRILNSIAMYSTNVSYNPYNSYYTTNYTWTVAVNNSLTNSASAGDTLYQYAVKGVIPVGATNLTLGPGADMIIGQFQTPTLFSINYTSKGQINLISGITQ